MYQASLEQNLKVISDLKNVVKTKITALGLPIPPDQTQPVNKTGSIFQQQYSISSQILGQNNQDSVKPEGEDAGGRAQANPALSMSDKGADPAQPANNKDAFMTDAIQLIGLIYKYAKMRRIPASEFEEIIKRSYDMAWSL